MKLQHLWPSAGSRLPSPLAMGSRDSLLKPQCSNRGSRQSSHLPSSWKMERMRFDDNLWPFWDFSICWPCLPCCGVSISLPSPGFLCAPIREPLWPGFHWQSSNPAAVNLSWVTWGSHSSPAMFSCQPPELPREPRGSQLAF